MSEMDDLQERINTSRSLRDIRLGLWRRWRPLARDKEFILETARLKFNLAQGFVSHPELLKSFFRPIFEPTLLQARRAGQQVDRVEDKHLQAVLRRYILYVLRFGVVMALADTPPHFRTQMLADVSRKFEARVIEGNLSPTRRFSSEDIVPIPVPIPAPELFGSDTVEVEPKMQQMIDKGQVRYVQLRDKGKRSLLKQLVDFAYSPNELTFVLLEAEQKYVFCLIGENVSVDETWRNASRVVAELQKKHYGRVRAGRPTDRAHLHRDLAILLRRKGTLKDRAISTTDGTTEKKVYSKMSSLSQLKAKLKI